MTIDFIATTRTRETLLKPSVLAASRCLRFSTALFAVGHAFACDNDSPLERRKYFLVALRSRFSWWNTILSSSNQLRIKRKWSDLQREHEYFLLVWLMLVIILLLILSASSTGYTHGNWEDGQTHCPVYRNPARSIVAVLFMLWGQKTIRLSTQVRIFIIRKWLIKHATISWKSS